MQLLKILTSSTCYIKHRQSIVAGCFQKTPFKFVWNLSNRSPVTLAIMIFVIFTLKLQGHFGIFCLTVHFPPTVTKHLQRFISHCLHTHAKCTHQRSAKYEFNQLTSIDNIIAIDMFVKWGKLQQQPSSVQTGLGGFFVSAPLKLELFYRYGFGFESYKRCF